VRSPRSSTCFTAPSCMSLKNSFANDFITSPITGFFVCCACPVPAPPNTSIALNRQVAIPLTVYFIFLVSNNWFPQSPVGFATVVSRLANRATQAAQTEQCRLTRDSYGALSGKREILVIDTPAHRNIVHRGQYGLLVGSVGPKRCKMNGEASGGDGRIIALRSKVVRDEILSKIAAVRVPASLTNL